MPSETDERRREAEAILEKRQPQIQKQTRLAARRAVLALITMLLVALALWNLMR